MTAPENYLNESTNNLHICATAHDSNNKASSLFRCFKIILNFSGVLRHRTRYGFPSAMVRFKSHSTKLESPFQNGLSFTQSSFSATDQQASRQCHLHTLSFNKKLKRFAHQVKIIFKITFHSFQPNHISSFASLFPTKNCLLV